MKVVVTGATGFLGRRTAIRLKAQGNQVTAVGRNTSLGAELVNLGIAFRRADLTQPENLDSVFAGHDGVVHCAALSAPWGKYQDFYRANVVATQNVINECKKAEIGRLVHVSTPSIYVDHSDKLSIRESESLPKRPINFYSQTKLMAEECVDRSVRNDGLGAITIRPQGIVGPGDSSILPRLLRLAKRGVLPVIGNGKNKIDLTYVDNVADALILALRAPASVNGKKYNISNGEPVLLYDMLEEIYAALGFQYKKRPLSFRKAYLIASLMEFACRNFLRRTEPILTCYSVCVLGRSRTLNIDAAKDDLGYRPAVSMREAIARIVQDYQVSPDASHLPSGVLQQ